MAAAEELGAPLAAELAMAPAAPDTERPCKPTRHRRLSILSLNEQKEEERGVGEHDTAGRTIQADTSDRHRRLPVVGLYTGEERPAADDGAGPDPQTSEHANVVSTIGYTSKAGFEMTGHKKTNQDAFVVLQVS